MIRTPIEPCLRALRAPYPEPEILREAIRGANRSEVDAICRLWLTEGIPAAFLDDPFHYECVRSSLAARLDLEARAISLAGSCRLGYSLRPDKFGSPYTDDSDLDVFIVDDALFQQCIAAAERWKTDVVEGRRKPRNSREEGFWKDTLRLLPQQREWGFIHPRSIPESPEYDPVPRIQQAVRRARAQLEALGKPRKLSARIYQNWSRACARLGHCLRRASAASG